MKIQYVFVVGDIHGEWDSFNRFINKRIRGDKTIVNDIKNGHDIEILLLQCGDFGFWPHFDGSLLFSKNSNRWDQWGIKHKISGIKNDHIKIIWCAGNHENHEILDNLESNTKDKFIEIDPIRAPNIFYATFGSIYTLLDNTKVMFCGGAASIDKACRIPGISWWEGETISESDMHKLPDSASTQVDIVVSHTCPRLFDRTHAHLNMVKFHDPSKIALDYVFRMYKPTTWFYGHYHNYTFGIIENCSTYMLNRIDGSNGLCFIKWRIADEMY